MIRRYLAVFTTAATLAAGESALAGEVQRLQGLFCNTEAQIDQALAGIATGVPPWLVANVVNGGIVACTYVDGIEYLIARPAVLGDPALPFVKYRGALVGVVAGGVLRPVTPEAEVYFLTPQEVAGAAIERRI